MCSLHSSQFSSCLWGNFELLMFRLMFDFIFDFIFNLILIDFIFNFHIPTTPQTAISKKARRAGAWALYWKNRKIHWWCRLSPEFWTKIRSQRLRGPAVRQLSVVSQLLIDDKCGPTPGASRVQHQSLSWDPRRRAAPPYTVHQIESILTYPNFPAPEFFHFSKLLFVQRFTEVGADKTNLNCQNSKTTKQKSRSCVSRCLFRESPRRPNISELHRQEKLLHHVEVILEARDATQRSRSHQAIWSPLELFLSKFLFQFSKRTFPICERIIRSCIEADFYEKIRICRCKTLGLWFLVVGHDW